MTQAIANPPDVDWEIRDANLGLIASTARLLEEAERVRSFRNRLLEAIDRKSRPEGGDQ
jgi:hypothetical protein